MQPSEQSGFTQHHFSECFSAPRCPQDGLNAPPVPSTGTYTRGIAAFLYKERGVLLRPHSCVSPPPRVPFHNFIVGGKSLGGALPIRPPQDKWPGRLTSLAGWFFWVHAVPRKALFLQGQGACPCLQQAVVGRARGHPTQAGKSAQELRGQARRLPLSSPALLSGCPWLSVNSSSSKEGRVDIIQSLNLFHILTYLEILLHHFPQ